MMGTFFKMLISLACVGGVVYWVYKNRERILTFINEQQKGDNQPMTEETVDSNVSKVLFPKESFIVSVSKFSGSFEPLYRAVNNSDTLAEEKASIFQDWTLRMMATPGKERFQAWLKDIECDDDAIKLKKLLDELVKCGVVRDCRSTFVVDEISAKNYIEWTGAELQNGNEVKVGSAAWMLNGLCIEKGIVSKI